MVVESQICVPPILGFVPRTQDSPASVLFAQLLEDVPDFVVVGGEDGGHCCPSREKWAPNCHLLLMR